MNELRSSVLSDNKKFFGQCEIIYGRFSDKKARHFAKEELYWALLAKFVDRIPEEVAKKLQKGLQSRVVEAHKDVPFCLGVMHFINSTLIKCPMMVAHNSNLFAEIAHKCLDFACEQWLVALEEGECVEGDGEGRCDVAVKLATEIYFASIQLKQQSRILVTITDLLTKQPSHLDTAQLLPLVTIKNIRSDNRRKIAAFLWMVYSGIVELADSGSEINLSDYVNAFESSIGLKDELLLGFTVNSLRIISRSTGFGFSRLSNRVLNILSNYEMPDRIRWETYRIVNEVLGVGSLIYAHFHQFHRPLVVFLQSKSESPPQELVSLVISLMKTSLPVLNVKAIYELQSAVCAKALAWNPSIEVLSLLNALLEFSHDEIPLPLQLAQCIFWKSFEVTDSVFMEQVEKGRSLCSTYSRPKIPVVPVKVKSEEVYTIADDQHVDFNQPMSNGLRKSPAKRVEPADDYAGSHIAFSREGDVEDNENDVGDDIMDDQESGELVDEDTASVLVISDEESEISKRKENEEKNNKQKVKEMLLSFNPN